MKKLLLVLLVSGIHISLAQQYSIIHCSVENDAAHFLTKKLADVPEARLPFKEILGTKKHEDEARELSAEESIHQKTESTVDGALQKNYKLENPTTTVEVLSNWAGMRSGYLRSDNNIAVGPNHVIQIINSNTTSSLIRVWDKQGNLLVKKKFISDLTGINDYGDPNIIYDQQADRYLISFLYSGNDWKLILCCSQTNDPTGAYNAYVFDTPGGFPDYEKLGVWGDSYVVTCAKTGDDVFVINRDQVLSGAALNPILMFESPKCPTIGWQALSPINQIGALDAPQNQPRMLMRVVDKAWSALYDTDHLELFSLNIDWSNPSNSTMVGPTSLPIAEYNSDLCGFNTNSCLSQKGTNVKLWPCSDYIMNKAQYRNFGDHESIVGSHVCNVDGQGTAGTRWYELRKENAGNWYLYQQGTYSPTNDDRFMSSITINDKGTIALGHNITSAFVYPGMRVTGRAACDDLNQMTAPEKNIKPGMHANATLDYGDYNGMVTDPVDGSFWFTAQYNNTAKWSTNVVHFVIHSCADSVQRNAPDAAATNVSISDLKFSPNPADESLDIYFTASKESKALLNVYDVNGKKVLAQVLNLSEGENETVIQTSEFQNGNYVVQLNSGSIFLSKKLVVQH